MSVVVVVAAVIAAAAPLSVDDVVRAVEDHHPSIAVALAEAAAARGELLAQEGAFDPIVKARALGDAGSYESVTADVGVEVPTSLWGASVTGGWRVGAGDFPVYEGKSKTNDGGELRLGLLLPLLRDGPIDRRRAGVERVALEQRVQEQAVRQARLELLRVGSQAWWDWVAAGARVDVMRRSLTLAEERDRQLHDRALAGDVPLIERRDNDRLVAQRRARLVAAERAFEKTSLDLSLFLRDEDGAPVVAGRDRLPSFSPPVVRTDDRDGLLDEALTRRPDLARLLVVGEQIDVDQRLSGNQLLPGLSLQASLSQDVGPTAPPRSSSSSVWNPDPKTRAPPDAEVGLVFELPVPLRQARGRVAVVEAARSRWQQQLRFARERITVEVDDARSAARAALARLGAATMEVDAALAVEEAERARFDAGDSTLLLVNLREAATIEAQLAVVDATLEARRADVALATATARLLPTG